jgi:hypothetical protein
MAALAIASIPLAIVLRTYVVRLRGLRSKYAPVIDIGAEEAKLRAAIESMRKSQAVEEKSFQDKLAAQAAEAEKTEELKKEAARRYIEEVRSTSAAEETKLREEIAKLAVDGTAEREKFAKLRHEIDLLEENLEDISFGVYEPHYKFDSSAEYKAALARIRGEQREMIRSGAAVIFRQQWTVGGDPKQGQRLQKQYAKLMLRAFNGECDACVANVAWNNVGRMQERIFHARDSLNTLGEVMQISIVDRYTTLKIDEIRLAFETEDKKHDEIEEQRRVKEQARYEERALREAEQAQQKAEAEETRYEYALAKAKAEVEKATGEKLTTLTGKVAELERLLAEARELKQRAMSLAELTRSGYVYVISNEGSFGANVLKIGLTRRLEPLERVYELSGASVPFAFDVHAMIYATDAPKLENDFHNYFAGRRLNLVNLRKEFFHVSLDEIEAFAKERNLTFRLTKLAEARQYRETLALRAKAQGQTPPVSGQPIAGNA